MYHLATDECLAAERANVLTDAHVTFDELKRRLDPINFEAVSHLTKGRWVKPVKIQDKQAWRLFEVLLYINALEEGMSNDRL